MPYKDPKKTAEAMRKYRLKKNPQKAVLHNLNILFSQAFVHAVHYPNLDGSLRKSHWIHALFDNPYYHQSVEVMLLELRNMLDVIDLLTWNICYKSPISEKLPNEDVPEEHRKLFAKEQSLLHDFYEKAKRNELKLEGLSETLEFRLPCAVLDKSSEVVKSK